MSDMDALSRNEARRRTLRLALIVVCVAVALTALGTSSAALGPHPEDAGPIAPPGPSQGGTGPGMGGETGTGAETGTGTETGTTGATGESSSPSPQDTSTPHSESESSNQDTGTGAARSDADGSTPSEGGRSNATSPPVPSSDGGGVVDIDLRGFFEWALGQLADGLVELISGLLSTLLKPIVGTPAPTTDDGWFVFGTPANQPWTALYEQVYLRFVVPLSAASIFLAFAYVGVRTGGTPKTTTRRLLGRIGIATAALFLWFPLASGALQLFDAIGVVIATGGDSSTGALVENLDDALTIGSGGAVLVLVVYAIESTLVLLAAVAYAVRWLGLIVLTLTMPLLAAAWALDTWPLTPLAAIARRTAAMYPGLLIAGLPAAFLLRIAVAAEFNFGFGGLFGVLASAALLPAAMAASAATVLWSHRRIDRLSNRSARSAESVAQNSPAAARAAKRHTGDTVRGARNVHRGLTQRPAINADGDEELWSGDSTAHRVGRRGRTAATHSSEQVTRGKHRLSEYRTAHADPDGSVGSELRRDAARAGSYARDGITGAVRETRRKISRW